MAVNESDAIPITIKCPYEPINKVLLEDVYKGLLDALDSVEKKLPRFKLILVEIAVLVSLLACLAATRHVDSIKHRRLLNAKTWEWTLLLIAVFSGLSIVRFATYIACLPLTRCWRLRIRRNLLFFVLRVKTNVDVVLWLALILVAWCTTVKPGLADKAEVSEDHATLAAYHLITGLLIAITMGSFLWLLKNLLYLNLEADLHYNQLFDSIHRTLTDFHVIHVILKGEKGWRFWFTDHHHHHHPHRQEKYCVDDKFWLNVFKMERETAPLWIVRRLSKGYVRCMKHVRLPGNPDSRDEQKHVNQARYMLQQVTGETENSDISKDQLRRLFFGPNDLCNSDSQEADQELISHVLRKINMEGDEKQEKIAEHDFLSWAVTAYRSCWSLQCTLESSKSAFIKLNRLMNVFVITIVLLVWLLLSRIVTTGQLALLFSPFLAASFIFGESCKKMFDGLIFAFSIRPFDVGDRVVIDGMQMKVTKLHILTTVFFKYDTQEEIVYPNSSLMQKTTANLDIVPDQSDTLEFTIRRNTPIEDIKELELKIIKYLEDDSDYGPSKVVKKALVGEEQIEMAVYFKYMVSYIAADCRAVHKSKILTKIIEFCKEIEDRNNMTRSYPSKKKPDIVEFIFDGHLTLEQINQVKEEIMRCLEHSRVPSSERYKIETKEVYNREYSKVVIKEITKEEITMALCLVDHSEITDGEKEEGKSKVVGKIKQIKHFKRVVE